MIGNPASNGDFVPGLRLLTSTWGGEQLGGFGSSSRRAALLHVVTSVDDRTFTTRDHLGGVHEGRLRSHEAPDMGRDRSGMAIPVVWSSPLPDAPFAEIAVLADALLQSDWRDPPLLLLCDSVDADGAASCRMVLDASDPDDLVDAGDAPVPSTRIGAAVLVDAPIRLLPGLDLGVGGWTSADDAKPLSRTLTTHAPAPGDLLVLRKAVATADEAPTISKAHVLLVRGGMDAEAVGRWMAPPDERRSMCRGGPRLMNPVDLGMEMERAVSRTRPDEIVAIAIPQEDGDVHVAHLSRTGIKTHDVDALDDHLYGQPLDPGVWLATGVTWCDAGEDGAEITMDWTRATRADLDRHGLTIAEVAETWSDLAEADIGEAAIAAMLTVDAAPPAA